MVNVEVQPKEEIPQELVDQLRTTKVPCPHCASTIVIFADPKPRIELYAGKETAIDYMRCLSCSALYDQFYY